MNLTNVEFRDENDANFNLSLSCQSYNADEPSIPYPDTFDMSHDGITIFLQCKNAKGETVVVSYSGD